MLSRTRNLALLTALLLLPTQQVWAGTPSAAAKPDSATSNSPRTVTAVRETPPLFDDEAGGDADADDPAIWVDPRRPERSLVIGAVKNAGLRVYDLAGHQLQSIATPPAPDPDSEPGRFNNVDLAYGVRLGGSTADLAIVTDRGRDQLRIYRIDPAARRLIDVTVADAPLLFSKDQDEVNEAATGYGLATFVRDGTATRWRAAGTPAASGCSASARSGTGSATSGSPRPRCRRPSASRTVPAGVRATSRASARRSRG